MRTIKQTLSAINGRTRGAYVVTAKRVAELNEIIVTLWEVVGGYRYHRATAYIDCGHTREDRHLACGDALQQAAAMLRLDPSEGLQWGVEA